jgi:hypothetical protein
LVCQSQIAHHAAAGELSTQEVASPLVGHHVPDAEQHTPEVDWVWLAVLTLRQWW